MSIDITPGKPLRVYNSTGEFCDYSTDEFVGGRQNQFHGWLCGIGTDNLHINMDGDIYGGSCRVGGKYGNIFSDFTIPENWTQCNRKLCACGADLFIPKCKTADGKKLLRRTANLPVQHNLKVNKISSHELSAIERTHSPGCKQVYWEIGRRCNYDCSYCWPWIHNNHERHKTLEELISATQKLEEKFMKGDRVNFIISGGEPTINPAFLDWARYIHGFKHHLSMHSNGSRQPSYYRELIYCGDLNLSAHFEFLNQEKFLKVVEAITEEKVKAQNVDVGHLEVKIMMAPGRRLEALQLEQELRKIPNFARWCTWAVVPIRDGKMGDEIMKGYEPADFEMFGDRV